VLLAEGETVLQGMIDSLIETERRYGMEMNVETTKVMRISRQPSPIQIMVDQKQQENVEYFNYLGIRITNDAKYRYTTYIFCNLTSRL
jgi:CYTH domain-containing protein